MVRSHLLGDHQFQLLIVAVLLRLDEVFNEAEIIELQVEVIWGVGGVVPREVFDKRRPSGESQVDKQDFGAQFGRIYLPVTVTRDLSIRLRFVPKSELFYKHSRGPNEARVSGLLAKAGQQ